VGFQIDRDGMVQHPRVINKRSPAIERNTLKTIQGIIVHQTGSSSAASTFGSYKKAGANGAHFLIDKDGTIYQTASLFKTTAHVYPIKARCIAEITCKPTIYKSFSNAEVHRLEMKKSIPARYPSNQDSVGIEIVASASLPPNFKVPINSASQTPDQLLGEFGVYEQPSASQNVSLKFLIDELVDSFKVTRSEIFRHPVVSFKNPTEAAGAKW
jgi:N-acetyl-anhydromuramyl-L-alanine amidase AmpD